MPVFEDLIAVILVLGGGGLIAIYSAKFINALVNHFKPKDVATERVEEAAKRLRIAKAELQASKIEAEASKLERQSLDELIKADDAYKETLDELELESTINKKVS